MLRIAIIPALKTNYVFFGSYAGKNFVVDPGEARPVVDFLSAAKLDLHFVFITHHHLDHTAGVADLKGLFKDLQVFGSQRELHLMPFRCEPFPQSFYISDLQFEVLNLPGHTIGHVGIYVKKAKILFCGDVLFSGGCGRVFEGTMAQMLNSLDQINFLPADVKIYFAHEYTLNNLEFATSINKRCKNLKAELENVKKLRSKNLPTTPTTLAKERLINPFLRLFDYKSNFSCDSRVEIFKNLRLAKDRFC